MLKNVVFSSIKNSVLIEAFAIVPTCSTFEFMWRLILMFSPWLFGLILHFTPDK